MESSTPLGSKSLQDGKSRPSRLSQNTSDAQKRTDSVCVVGLGYVGLPLTVEFDRAGYDVIGFDVSSEKVDALKANEDPTGDVDNEELRDSDIEFTTDPELISESSYVIIAVPTPVTSEQNPDLSSIESAGETIGPLITPGTVVVLESTVFPGATREVLAPAIEESSGMSVGEDFFVGYSPERLVPGDDEHSLRNVVKIVSGQTDEVLEDLVNLYGDIVDAGVHKAPEIEVAEAAKCIENIQRDINIALMNELAITCDTLGIDTQDVLEAASTKWNFHDYRPGIVGGHCIPVDPFFLIYQSKRNGFDPELVQKAREVNDYVPKHVAEKTIKAFNEAGKVPKQSRVLVLGLAYKPGVSDIRTSNIDGTIEELREYGVTVVGFDPNVDATAIESEFGIDAQADLSFNGFDAVIVGAAHEVFSELEFQTIGDQMASDPVFIDPANAFAAEATMAELDYWRL